MGARVANGRWPREVGFGIPSECSHCRCRNLLGWGESTAASCEASAEGEAIVHEEVLRKL